MKSRLVLLALCLPLAGCLQTRDSQKEQDEKQVFKKQLTTLQQTNADTNARFQDLEDEARRLGGRVEALEVHQNQAQAQREKNNSALELKMKEKDDAYREEFQKLHAEIDALKAQQAEDSRKAGEARAAAEARATEAAKNPLATAEELYDKKQWKDAILSYEKYRSANPKGKSLAAATYKIGVCFQELGMKEDAQAFYEEVIAKYPKSKDADKARERLKKLKKSKQTSRLATAGRRKA